MSTMISYNNDVRVGVFRHALNSAFRSTEYEMLVFVCNVDGRAKLTEMRLCLFLNRVLHRGQIHWNVATVRNTKGFNDMDNIERGSETLSDSQCLLGYDFAFFRQVDRQ